MDSDTRAAVTAVLEGTWHLLKVMCDTEPSAAEQAEEGSRKEHGGASEGGAARCDHGEGGHPPEKQHPESTAHSVALDEVVPIVGQAGVAVAADAVGPGARLQFGFVSKMLPLPGGRVLVAEGRGHGTHGIRVLSADLQRVSAVAGDGTVGHRDGAAAQAQFSGPAGLALRPDGCVLVTDCGNNRVRALSADLRQVTTVAGDGTSGHRDGAAAQAQFCRPGSLAALPGGCVLVIDRGNHTIRMLSADLQQVTTVVGGGCGYRDGAAALAQFRNPADLALLSDGRILVADRGNHRVRLLSADLQQVSTVAGNGEFGHRDGAAAQARLFADCLATLPDGRVLMTDQQTIRCLSADLQHVSTLTTIGFGFGGVSNPRDPVLLSDNRLLLADLGHARVLEGLVRGGAKPAPKVTKKDHQQQQQQQQQQQALQQAYHLQQLQQQQQMLHANLLSVDAALKGCQGEQQQQLQQRQQQLQLQQMQQQEEGEMVARKRDRSGSTCDQGGGAEAVGGADSSFSPTGRAVRRFSDSLAAPMGHELRRGRWTREEEAYAAQLVIEFNRGMLPESSEFDLSLRMFLASKLNCDPMRITKKFAGNGGAGTRHIKRATRSEPLRPARAAELLGFELAFLKADSEPKHWPARRAAVAVRPAAAMHKRARPRPTVMAGAGNGAPVVPAASSESDCDECCDQPGSEAAEGQPLV